MTQKTKSRKKIDIFYLLSCAVLVSLHGLLLLFIHRKLPYLLDSDMSSEMILGKILSEEGRIITDSWNYSTELRVANTQLVYAFFFMFTDNWHIVRMASTFVLHLILTASSFFICHAVGCRRFAPAVSCGLLLSFSFPYFFIVLMGCYYVPYIAVSFLTVGLLFIYVRSKKQRVRILSASIASLAAFVISLSGLREIVVTYIPLLMAVVLACLYLFFGKGWEKMKKSVYCRYLIMSVIVTLSACIGYLINAKVLAKKYYFYEWSEIKFTSFSIERFTRVLNDMCVTLGYDQKLLGVGTLAANAFFFCIACLLIYFIVYGIRNAGKVSTEYTLISVFFLCGTIILLLLFSLTDMDYTARYNHPLMSFVPVILAIGIREADFGKAPEKTASVIGIICALMVMGRGAININELRSFNRWGELYDCAQSMTTQGYTNGYATFWHGNIMTELSNGQIDMYAWKSSDDDGSKFGVTGSINSLYEWLQKKSHFEKTPEGKVFMLIARKELPYCKWKDKLSEDRIIYSNSRYIIYGYESYGEMADLFADYEYDVTSSEWLINGEVKDGKRIIRKEGISFGPYITFFKGEYEVTVTGEGLSGAEITPKNNDLMYTFRSDVVLADDKKIVMRFSSPDNVDGSEIEIKNVSDDDVVITGISIDWLG